MEQSLELIKTFEKVVCFVDEVDQMIGSRSGGSADGGVDARLFGMLLAATGSSDIKGKVLFLFSTNRVDMIDSALCDRTGINLVFLQPSAQEKKLLIPYLAKQQGRKLGEDVNVESLSKHPNLKGVSVRNIVDFIGHSGFYADMENGKANSKISHSHLERSIVLFNRGDILETEFITLLSLSFVRFLDQLPWIGPDGKMKKGYDFPSFLEDLVKEDGHIDILKLNRRLNEIRQLRARERMMR
jgi:SpoVK/Ycf46/Vps4 family AAA+-type ATPase